MEQIDRAVSIVKNPQAELNKVKSEQLSNDYLLKQYIAILALIPTVAYIIGMGFVGINMGFLGGFKLPIQTAIVGGGLWDNIIRFDQMCLKQPHPHPTELLPEYNIPNYTLLKNQSLFQQNPL